MAETSEQADKGLRQEGYTPTTTDSNKYEKVNDRGGVDRAWTDGDWVYKDGSWTKK